MTDKLLIDRAVVEQALEDAAVVCDDAAAKLFCGKARVNQVDRHLAGVLRDKAAAIRALQDAAVGTASASSTTQQTRDL